MLSVHECAAGYGESPLFDGLSFSLPPGETATIVGPSGCGKSTLLAVLSGIKRAWRGEVLLDETPVRQGDRRIGLILQSYGLFPWMTVEQNVALGLRFRRVDSSSRRALVREELERLDILPLAGRYPAELSGGEQQRVAIARTFVVGPSLLLMDEPFSALDALSRERLQDALARRISGGRVITIFVTHSIEEAVYLGGLVIIFRPGPPARVTILRNEREFGPAFRLSARFFDRCREVRAILESAERESRFVATTRASTPSVDVGASEREGGLEQGDA